MNSIVFINKLALIEWIKKVGFTKKKIAVKLYEIWKPLFVGIVAKRL